MSKTRTIELTLERKNKLDSVIERLQFLETVTTEYLFRNDCRNTANGFSATMKGIIDELKEISEGGEQC